jgi:hypothetical protein
MKICSRLDRHAQLVLLLLLLAAGCSGAAPNASAASSHGATSQGAATQSGGTSAGAAASSANSAGGAPSTIHSSTPAVSGTGGPSAGSSVIAGQSGPAAGGGGALATAAGTGGPAGSAAVGGSVGGGGNSGAASPPAMAWPSVSDFGMTGPFKAITMMNSGPMNAYTLFYPEDLGRDGLKHPVITWGNGATSTPGQFTLLPLLASQGFVVVAANDAFVTSAEMKSGIDWAFQENDRQGSAFYQKLDPSKVAAMGWSLGSLGSFQIASDPRIITTVHISGGAMDKSVVPNLRHPAAFFCGNSSDIAHDNCESDFTMAKVPVFYGVFPGDHFGIVGSFAPQINKAAAAWLRWRLMGDTSLSGMFVGADCTVCKDTSWVVKQRELDNPPP